MNSKFIFFTFLCLQSLVFSSYNVPVIECRESCFFIDNNPQKQAAKLEIAISLESTLMIVNNHVGDDWKHFLSINDQVVFKGESLNLSLNSRAPLRIEAHSVEEDNDYPDSGKNHMDFIYSDLIAIEKNRFEMDVTIVENGGQYAGNTAVVKFLFIIQQV